MWSALMNGSGLHGGGGAGGGYVPSQGWEFVPSSRMDRTDRGRGKARNPLRRISSPPTVFSQVYESQFGASTGGGGGEGILGTQLEMLGGQMWSRPESPQQQQQQQQTQHIRLKKKCDELKKRHVQDKEEWTREKESLLREVADLQGGENRRILLDLKTVLEEVQAEVKREEEKRSELQLQYTRDRCAWELEKAELKCRIAQLEVRGGTGLASRGVQSAAGLGSVAPRGTQVQCGETPTLHREREEQRRLLADTRSAAMDLRYRLEHNERDWLREKAELLERFDMERKEWETQLKDMQKKIEKLYCEVRFKREGTRLDSDDVVHRLSIPSTSTGSSLLSDNSHSEPLSGSSSQSEQNRQAPFPGFGLNRNISDRESRQHARFQVDSLCDFNVGGPFSQNEPSQPLLVDDLRSRGTWQQDSVDNKRVSVDTTDMAAIFNGAPECQTPQKNASYGNEINVPVGPQESPAWADLYGSDKKRNTTTLNAALKEIARVSEELCSYQDEIRNKSGDKRNQSEFLGVSEEDEPPCDLSQIYDDFRALERENWITLSPDNTLRTNTVSDSWRTSAADPNSCRDTQTILSEIDTAAPPIPPRSSSWNLSTSALTDTELHIPESPTTTAKRCHSPCVLVDRKCSSPSIVRKFEAMLQENEGKVFIDGAVSSCSVPAHSNCNMACCHNRWSCDASKFSGSKLSPCGTEQKSFSEVSILAAAKDLHSDCNPGVGNLKNPDLQTPPGVTELPVDVLLSSLEKTPVSPDLQGSRRNIMLEQKTAEFNRTLFQAEMGRSVKQQDSFTITDASSPGCQAVSDVLLPRETGFQPHCTDLSTGVMGVNPEVISDSTFQNTEVLPRGLAGGVRIKQETPSDLSFEQPQVGLRDTTTIISQSPAHQPEVKHKVQTPSSPSRKAQRRAATGAVSCEPVSSANDQPGQNMEDSNLMNEIPHGAKLQPAARVVAPIQQLSVENKQRPMTQPEQQAQPRHVSSPPSQSDSTRHGPRMMIDHPWKTLNLAAYPRPEGSRSNYGAVERILKNYETAARAQQSQSQLSEMTSHLSVVRMCGKQETVTELDMLDMDPLPLPPTHRHVQTSNTAQTHTTHAQLSSHTAVGAKEIQLIVQANEVSASSVPKCFSRPTRPSNRRLPSRWASRSPTSSSSITTTPILPPSCRLQKPTSSFTYAHAFHIETPPHCVYEPEARSFQ